MGFHSKISLFFESDIHLNITGECKNKCNFIDAQNFHLDHLIILRICIYAVKSILFHFDREFYLIQAIWCRLTPCALLIPIKAHMD